MRDIKRNFVRFGIEEHLRRTQREPESITEKIKTILFPEATVNFIEPIWKLRKIEIDDLMQPKGDAGNDVFAKYKIMADKLRVDYGYGKAEEIIKEIDTDNVKDTIIGGTVSFDNEISKLFDGFSFTNKNTTQLVQQIDKSFVNNKKFVNVCNLLMGSKADSVTDIFSVPYLKEDAQRGEMVLSMVIQNCFHHQNSTRVDNTTNGKYIEFVDGKQAYKYLTGLLEDKLR